MLEINHIEKPDSKASPAKRAAYQQQIVDAFKRSGQTMAEFARAQGINPKYVSKWKRRLETAQSRKKTPSKEKLTMSVRGPLNHLVTVTAPQSKGISTVLKDPEGGKIELKHPNGFMISIDAKTDSALLKKVLKLLGELT